MSKALALVPSNTGKMQNKIINDRQRDRYVDSQCDPLLKDPPAAAATASREGQPESNVSVLGAQCGQVGERIRAFEMGSSATAKYARGQSIPSF